MEFTVSPLNTIVRNFQVKNDDYVIMKCTPDFSGISYNQDVIEKLTIMGVSSVHDYLYDIIPYVFRLKDTMELHSFIRKGKIDFHFAVS